MADLSKFQEVLRARFKLKALEQESDLIYKIDDLELESIINLAVVAHNASYTLDTLPQAEEPFVLWLAEIELLYMFASANARFFSISASGAAVNKQERVNHYLSIIDRLQRKYDSSWERFLSLNPEQIEVANSFIKGVSYGARVASLAQLPTVKLEVVKNTDTTADLQWKFITKLEPSIVYLYQSNSLIIDEWEEPVWMNGVHVPILPNAVNIFKVNNKFRDKFRVKNLQPATPYNFAAIVVDKGSRWNHHEVTMTTASEVV